MASIIPITPATIDLVQKLNDGVRPERDDAELFYVYRGENEISEIIDWEEYRNSGKYPEWMTCTVIYHTGN